MHPGARAVVIVIHGFKGFKDWGFFPWLTERLVDHQLAVCRFNMSRSGIGDDPETFERLDLFADDCYSTQLADLRVVTGWVAARVPDLPIFLLGHSRGGAVALLAAAGVPGLKGLVLWSPISHVNRWDDETVARWKSGRSVEVINARTKQAMPMSRRMLDDFEATPERFDVMAAARSLAVHSLVIHGARDESVPVAEGRAIAGASPLGSILVIENAGHTFNAIHPLVHVPFELSLAAEVSAHFVNAWAKR